MYRLIVAAAALMLIINSGIQAQRSPMGKEFGFGIIIGDPLGGTIKYWTGGANALNVELGNSYFGSPRIDVDYLWHFDAFRSRIVFLYAGAGGVLGFGRSRGFLYKDKGRFYSREGDELGVGMRGLFGLDIVPSRTPLEIFFQFGVLVGLAPEGGSAVDLALGIRFYP